MERGSFEAFCLRDLKPRTHCLRDSNWPGNDSGNNSNRDLYDRMKSALKIKLRGEAGEGRAEGYGTQSHFKSDFVQSQILDSTTVLNIQIPRLSNLLLCSSANE